MDLEKSPLELNTAAICFLSEFGAFLCINMLEDKKTLNPSASTLVSHFIAPDNEHSLGALVDK